MRLVFCLLSLSVGLYTWHSVRTFFKSLLVLFFAFCLRLLVSTPATVYAVSSKVSPSVRSPAPTVAALVSMFTSSAKTVQQVPSLKHVSSVTSPCIVQLRCSERAWPVTCYFLPPQPVNSGPVVAWPVSDWSTDGCLHDSHVLEPDRLSAARSWPLCCLCVRCV